LKVRVVRVSRVLIAVVAAGLLSACASDDGLSPDTRSTGTPSPQPERRAETVGAVNDIPGLNYLDPDESTRSGFELDVIRWIGNNSEPGFRPVLTDLTVPDREQAIVDGRVDMVIAVFSITDKHRGAIGMAGPYLRTRQGVLVRSGDRRITTTNDLGGKSVCTLEGSTSIKQLEPLVSKDILLTSEKNNKQCVDRLREGKVDAVSTDQLILAGFAQKYPRELKVTDVTFGNAEEYGIGFRKGDMRTCQMLRAGIEDLLISPSWDAFFRTNFPGLAGQAAQYKPEPESLDPCVTS
jgi:glutamate transport system substrate-binding protein